MKRKDPINLSQLIQHLEDDLDELTMDIDKAAEVDSGEVDSIDLGWSECYSYVLGMLKKLHRVQLAVDRSNN